MELKTPNSASAGNTGALALGIVAGGFVSKGVISLVHKDAVLAANPTLDELKAEKSKKTYKRAGLALLTGVAAFFVKGDDALTNGLKGSLIGMSATQAMQIVSENATPKTATTKTARFINASLGLGCPCNDTATIAALNAPRYRSRASLRSAVAIEPGQTYAPSPLNQVDYKLKMALDTI